MPVGIEILLVLLHMVVYILFLLYLVCNIVEQNFLHSEQFYVYIHIQRGVINGTARYIRLFEKAS